MPLPPPTPPGGETPLPPADEPFAPPRATPAPPFDDAPPGLPPSGTDTPPTDMPPGPPADARPSEELPEPPKSDVPFPDVDAPPKMPDDDPFKDDPESPLAPPPGATPKSEEGTRTELPRQVQEAAKWRVPGSAASQPVAAGPTCAPATAEEPRRLQVDVNDNTAALAPARPARANPLRSTSHVRRGESVVPTASYTGTARGDGGGTQWRSNPLRSN
jgi:hypothetical protein